MKFNKIILCMAIFIFSITNYAPSVFAREKSYPSEIMGLQPMTEEQLERKREITVKTKSVKINDLALERINDELKKEGKPTVDYDTVEFGEETISENDDFVTIFSENQELDILLPKAVDNMTDPLTAKFFPPAGDQGMVNSCAAFASTYYQMTYMNAKENGYDLYLEENQNKILSPQFTFNIAGLSDNLLSTGMWSTDAYAVVKKHGCLPKDDFPYSGNRNKQSHYLKWPTTFEKWEKALNVKVKECGTDSIVGEDGDTDTPVKNPQSQGLENIKTYLADGYILNIVTRINAWDDDNILNPEVNHADGYICKYVKTVENCLSENPPGKYDGRLHAMTVVGYDDEIWCDIDGDNVEDDGEFGAFKIINSQGEDNCYETWFAYDALNRVSYVTGETHDQGWLNNEYTWVTMCKNYTPKLLAKFKITTDDRGRVDLSLGYGDMLSSNSTKQWYPYIFTETNKEERRNHFSIGGKDYEETAEIVLDYTDLIEDDELDKIDSELKWYLSSDANISEFEIVDVPFEKHYTVSEILPNDSGSISGQAQLPLKVSKDKIWNISANYPLNTDTINSDNVRIRDKENAILPANISIKNDTNVNISPVTTYEKGKYYTLEIDGLKTLAGNGMKTTIKKNFFVSPDNIEKDKFSIEDAFTDNNFLNAIRDLVNKPDGYIYWSDVRGIKELNITGKNISSLDGLEYFTSLEQLDCSHNNLEELDLSKNIKLKKLNVLCNELTTLDLSHNSLITELKVDDDVIVTY